jgi:hypothetical protein
VRESADQGARRIRDRGDLLGKVGAGMNFGVRDEIDQDTVEQLHVLGPKTGSPPGEQFGDPASHFSEALRIALADNLIELGDRRICSRHEHTQPGKAPGFSAI